MKYEKIGCYCKCETGAICIDPATLKQNGVMCCNCGRYWTYNAQPIERFYPKEHRFSEDCTCGPCEVIKGRIIAKWMEKQEMGRDADTDMIKWPMKDECKSYAPEAQVHEVKDKVNEHVEKTYPVTLEQFCGDVKKRLKTIETRLELGPIAAIKTVKYLHDLEEDLGHWRKTCRSLEEQVGKIEDVVASPAVGYHSLNQRLDKLEKQGPFLSSNDIIDRIIALENWRKSICQPQP